MIDFKSWNAGIIREFRENGGHVAEFAGRPLVLLHSRGARTGQERINPLMYLEDGGRLILFASRAGEPINPDWYHNVRANPEVEIELGAGTRRGVAEEVTGEERDRLYAEMVRRYPQFGEYQQATTRRIPVVAVTFTD